jgi:hypothetical protein
LNLLSTFAVAAAAAAVVRKTRMRQEPTEAFPDDDHHPDDERDAVTGAVVADNVDTVGDAGVGVVAY